MKETNKPVLVCGFGKIDFGKQYRQGNRVYDARCLAMGVCANPVGDAGGMSYCYLTEEKMDKEYRIRKLTPRECFKLMGFEFGDCDKASAVGISGTQLYKQAGNGIVTNCVSLLMEHLYQAQYDPSHEPFDEVFLRASITPIAT